MGQDGPSGSPPNRVLSLPAGTDQSAAATADEEVDSATWPCNAATDLSFSSRFLLET